MYAFMRSENAADDDSTLYLVVANFHGFEFDFAIAQQNGVAFTQGSGETGKIDGHGSLRTQNLSRSQNERLAWVQPDLVLRDFSNANLWTWKVLENSDLK